MSLSTSIRTAPPMLAQWVFIGVVLLASSSGADPTPAEPEVFARMNVTVRDRDRGAAALPTPFEILPGEKRAALYVPESGGVLLLEGETIRHHFPIPSVPADASSAIDDLEATELLLVGGRWTPAGPVTAELFIFDLASGKVLDHIETRNPHLGGEANELARLLWRVVVDADTVGVYDPRLGATIPLWIRGVGQVASADQMAHVRSGIHGTWIPTADTALSYRDGGSSRIVVPASPGNWIYLEPVGVPVISVDGASSREWRTVLALDEGSFLSSSPEKPESKLLVHVAAIPIDSAPGDVPRILQTIALDTHDEAVKVGARWMHGRPARREGPHLYWPYLGRDFVEIRRSPLAPSGG